MKIKKSSSLSSGSSLGILHFDHPKFTRLDSVDWLCSLPNKEDEKKIDDRWIEDAFKEYEDTNYKLANLIRDLKMEDAITCTPLNNTPSTNRRVTFSDANTNLSYYFNEIQEEKEGDETFAVAQSPLPLSVKRPNATTSMAKLSMATTSMAKLSMGKTSMATTSVTKLPMAATSMAKTSKVTISKVTTSRATILKTKTPKTKTPKAKTPKASTPKASTLKKPTSKVSTTRPKVNAITATATATATRMQALDKLMKVSVN